MPFIEVKTTEDLSAVAAELKSALGDAITAIPGKLSLIHISEPTRH